MVHPRHSAESSTFRPGPRRSTIGNVIYGVAKAARPKRVAADMAGELAPHGVTVVSLYPGLVRTEAVVAARRVRFAQLRKPDSSGARSVGLATEPECLRWNSQVVVSGGAQAREYGFANIDGARPQQAAALADM